MLCNMYGHVNQGKQETDHRTVIKLTLLALERLSVFMPCLAL